jgi:LysR family glycine cleavage system transcriptional activator
MITLSSQSGDAVRRHLAQCAFVEDDLRSGRLVAPLALRVHTASSYFLAYPKARRTRR